MIRSIFKSEPSTPLSEPTFCILAALVEPRHGYAVMQWVGEATEQRVKLGPGTLYGALTSLHEKGLITPASESQEGERRKVYVLTKAGRDLLEAETFRLESTAQIARKALHK